MQAGTTYTPNSSTTTASGGPIPTAPGLPTAGKIDPQFIALLQALSAAKKAPATQAPTGSHALAGGASLAGHVGMAPPSSHDNGLRALQEEAAAQQINAQVNPQPMRMTTFASGANNGYMPDVNAMNAFQRKAYLPQDSVPASKNGLF